ncbi:maleylpyruvate isomerase family mycothiol-dependent enzyme [Nocardioides alkalitolerans]|uniref:maleylpyruvate isomerase family mycothiol-dependent enzyme n=1 Tax=Nocardioides alkalitolerans TaxID=281714 RepID=UPI00040D07D1|nr:maleylpyruvate isomerase family mycothiol-dependent enzyme [Nocardioides alkalitolerans]
MSAASTGHVPPRPARLDAGVYLAHLVADSARFADVLAGCDATAVVPTCPGWDASDLLWHLTEVQAFWASVVRNRPAGPGSVVAPERPSSYDDLLALGEHGSEGLARVLAPVHPAELVWSWSGDHTAAFTYRRQAHEALVHRWDAELTAGVEHAPVDADLAADGVAEALEVMFGAPSTGFSPVGGPLEVRLGDVGARLVVRAGTVAADDGGDEREPRLEVLDDEAAATTPTVATLAGTAADVDAWLWRRPVAADAVRLDGDATTVAAFRAAVARPLG